MPLSLAPREAFLLMYHGHRLHNSSKMQWNLWTMMKWRTPTSPESYETFMSSGSPSSLTLLLSASVSFMHYFWTFSPFEIMMSIYVVEWAFSGPFFSFFLFFFSLPNSCLVLHSIVGGSSVCLASLGFGVHASGWATFDEHLASGAVFLYKYS